MIEASSERIPINSRGHTNEIDGIIGIGDCLGEVDRLDAGKISKRTIDPQYSDVVLLMKYERRYMTQRRRSITGATATEKSTLVPLGHDEVKENCLMVEALGWRYFLSTLKRVNLLVPKVILPKGSSISTVYATGFPTNG